MVFTAEENDRTDDIIDWETAYKIFFETQGESFDKYLEATAINDDKLDSIIKELKLDDNNENSIRTFILVMSLIAHASAIKKLVQKIVKDYHS